MTIFVSTFKFNSDPDIKEVMHLSSTVKRYSASWDFPVFDNEVLKRWDSNVDREVHSQLTLPKKWMLKLLKELHNGNSDELLDINGKSLRK